MCSNDFLFSRLSPNSVIIRISAPIKHHFAKMKNLDVDDLLSDGIYKENYRAEMILWGEEQRLKDPSLFCKSAIEMFNGKLNYQLFYFSTSIINTILLMYSRSFVQCMDCT